MIDLSIFSTVKMPGGKCAFNRKWLDSEDFKDWVEKDSQDRHKDNCKVCKCPIDIATMGSSALKSHAKGKSITLALYPR